jgi:hypothetical protein
MRTDIRTILSKVNTPPSEEAIAKMVLSRISIESRKKATKRLFLSISGFIASCAVAFVAGHDLIVKIGQSGTMHIISLIVHDSAFLTLYGKETLTALLESIPAFEIGISITAMALLYASLRFVLESFELKRQSIVLEASSLTS